ncbi:glycoside hydrolase family 13 protein [Arundinibacter roseus]|uniref:Alpha-amylase n=1 Tax=Arundinibacter roseus TaxID=2070510 RepID=A0A4R4KG99_9BACT|nr:glycoside hydrolase family 13 protein [Arundinibacter roseus]TDB67070.1 alpha-amylase [Arundinibacter roseus]
MNKTFIFKILIFLSVICGDINSVFGQTISIDRVEPLNWWIGMKDPRLQLLIHGENIAGAQVKIDYPGVHVDKVNQVENPNYLFVDLTISPDCRAGNFSIELSKEIISQKGKRKPVKTLATRTLTYELKPRATYTKGQGVTSADFIYLLLPDRFSNGDPTNDTFKDMADTQADRKDPFLRHGGDLQGIINHLDYFKELGVTALWLNPVLENNQPLTDEGGAKRSAYHGYGFTDHYQVDKRLGGNAAYKKLVEVAHANGLKIIQDAVYNHVGINHWLVKDLPSADWLHQWPTYTNTSYKDQPLVDPYASNIDKKVTSDGWFVPFLPDLNQTNPFVANYLIQHALWTVEYFGIDAWRIDTYMYNDLEFMNRCNAALLEEFPKLHIFGENWVNSIANQSYFQQNNLNVPFKSNLPGSCDFQLQFAINDALNQKPGWNEGIQRIYQVLGQDYLYKDASKLVTFLDNHDMDRYFSVIGENFAKYKMGLTFLLTTRGIPQLYYGTEILMKNFKNPSDAEVRRDFPGGFPGDSENKFIAKGRTAAENEAFTFVKTLANYRKNTSALHSGQLMQFLPVDGVYVYFRYDNHKTVMVCINSNESEIEITTERFQERMAGFASAKNILTDDTLTSIQKLSLPPQSAVVLELMK